MSEDNKLSIVVDATEYDNWQLCNFRWHAFHQRNIRPKNTESYFEKGHLLHYLLELYYTAKKDQRTIDQTLIEEIIDRARVASLKLEISTEEIGDTIFQFREYHRFYENETIIPLYIEEPFTVEIFEDERMRIFIAGKPDLIFRYAGQHDIIVMDHKGVSREAVLSALRNQFMLYATAMKTDTVIINKIGFQKTKTAKDRFNRTPFVYSQEILEEWRLELVADIKDMLNKIKDNNFPRNRTSCEKWNGCYLQRYCATRPSAREFLIGTEYLIGEEWDVGKRLEESNIKGD